MLVFRGESIRRHFGCVLDFASVSASDAAGAVWFARIVCLVSLILSCSVLCALCSPLKFIWLLQLVWWYCALHVNLWWTSWMAVELFGGPDPESAAAHKHKDYAAGTDPAVAIRLATIGLLVQAVVSFPASAALPWLNRQFGITNTYHASAILYGLAVLAIGFVSTYAETIVIMVRTNAAQNAMALSVAWIICSPFLFPLCSCADCVRSGCAAHLLVELHSRGGVRERSRRGRQRQQR